MFVQYEVVRDGSRQVVNLTQDRQGRSPVPDGLPQLIEPQRTGLYVVCLGRPVEQSALLHSSSRVSVQMRVNTVDTDANPYSTIVPVAVIENGGIRFSDGIFSVLTNSDFADYVRPLFRRAE